MSIKEEMKPKNNKDKAVKKTIKHPFTEDYEEKKEKTKKLDSAYEILKLKNCIKEKDKRIKKIEDYFWLRNHLILSVLASLLCFSPIIFMFLFLEPVPIDTIIPPSTIIFAVIGSASTVVCVVYSWTWLLKKIWSK